MKNKLYVSLMNSIVTPENRTAYADMMKKGGADHVFLALVRKEFHLRENSFFESLKSNIRYFEEEGFSVGVWITTFGYGDPLAKKYIPYSGTYTRIRSSVGSDAGDAFCPEDENFKKSVLSFIDRTVKCGAKMLMLDDELCLSVRPGLGCFCEKHIKLLEEELSESLEGKDLPSLFFTGKPNRYRDAFLKVEGDTHRRFAKKVREKVNETDKNIRVGFCAGYTSWDIEGIDAIELTKILAGDTKPFLRFTGAPYWVCRNINRFDGQHLNSINELARLQEKWARGSGVEVFGEADSYPRPRYTVPSSLIECFDVALNASGGMGNLKYMFDYWSSPEYEKGYMKHHLKNSPLRDFIHTHFDNKTASGVYVAEKMHKFSDMVFPDIFAGEEKLMLTAFSPAAAMLSSLGIPTTYDENPEIAIAFNENVNMFNKLPKKLIVDISAAGILQEKGIDTGLESSVFTDSPSVELTENEQVLVFPSFSAHYNCTLKGGAKVLSRFENEDGEFPAVYTYKNGETEFFVLTFDAYDVNFNSSLFVSYLRQEQLLGFIGGAFPSIKKEPGIYQLLKRNNKETAVLFENIWEDALFDFDIDLDYEYSSFEIFGADAVLDGKKLHITSEIAPYGMFAVVLKR